MLQREKHFLFRGDQKYILLAQSFQGGGIFVNVGYVDWLFSSKEEASKFYLRHQPNMRAINAHDTRTSDWHPVTRLRFCVVEPGRGTSTSIEHCRECLQGQKDALIALNEAVRQENNKNKDWPKTRLPSEEAQEKTELEARHARYFHESEYEWAKEAVLNAYDEGHHPVEHLAEEFDSVCGMPVPACWEGSVVVARALLDIGAVPTADHLHAAIGKKFEGIVALLLEDGRVTVDEEILVLAAISESSHVLRLLLGHRKWDREFLSEVLRDIPDRNSKCGTLLKRHI